MAPDGARLFALLGDPVDHSLSPAMQNAAFAAAGVDATYVAVACDADAFPVLFDRLARAGGGGGNVTVPHKRLAATLVDVPTPAVQRTDACNTFWGEEGRVRGDNTDVEGFAAAARSLVGDTRDARVLVLGAGGAARAAVLSLLQTGADVTVLNRTAERARSLQERLDPAEERVRVAEWVDDLTRDRFDLVVNATSLGLRPDDPLPFRFNRVARVGAVLDLVYGRDETRLVRGARERGVPAADGTEMLLHQGAAAFQRWLGLPAPVEAMRAALEAARNR